MGVAAVVFDLYGTLLAIDAMAAHVAAANVPQADAFVRDWRRKQLEYAFLVTLGQAYRTFDELTALALDQTCAARRVNLGTPARAELVDAWRSMPAFPDVAPALGALAARGLPSAVLTNGTPSSANAALERAGIRGLLIDVLSVESVRAYKPDPRVYALATSRFGCAPREIVFVSSNPWDAWGAANFGFCVAWCNRARIAGEALVPGPQRTLSGLEELAAFVEEVSNMSDDRAGTGNTAEPALTEKNSRTVNAEGKLGDASATAQPTSYGPHGGTTDAIEEGAGNEEAQRGSGT